MSEQFHDYLYGAKFEVVTDNNPLTYVNTTAKLDATSHRWLATLANYDYTAIYRPGSSNADADGLSRIISKDVIQAVIIAATTEGIPLVDTIKDPDTPSTDVDITKDIPNDLLLAQSLSSKDWVKAQRQDTLISRIVDCVKNGTKPAQPIERTMSTYLREWSNLVILQGVLYRKTMVLGDDRLQIVLPDILRQDIFKALHDDLGHQGRDRTTSLFKERFYWPGMDGYVADSVRKCGRCIRRKSRATTAELTPIESTAPMETICVDFLSLERSKGGFENILVLTDHFSRYAQAFPTRNQTAKTTARILFDNFVVHYGFPARIHSDQGRNFESNLIKELCSISGTEKTRTTPYHAMGNGMVERFNQTLLKMLGTLDDHQKTDWKEHVPSLVHAYNATHHGSTGFSPYFLMFGRHPRLAIDAFLGLPTDSLSSSKHTEYVVKLRARLHSAYTKARQVAERTSAANKTKYDKTARSSVLRTGDRVLVRNISIRGKQKLADKWEHHPYVVIRQPIEDIPVYEVKREGSRYKKSRTLHRNLLLPFMTIRDVDDGGIVPCGNTGNENTDNDDNDSVGIVDDEANRSNDEHSVNGVIGNDNVDTDKEDNDDDTDATNTYVIPAKRTPGAVGLLPPAQKRPGRQKRQPNWMLTGDYV